MTKPDPSAEPLDRLRALVDEAQAPGLADDRELRRLRAAMVRAEAPRVRRRSGWRPAAALAAGLAAASVVVALWIPGRPAPLSYRLEGAVEARAAGAPIGAGARAPASLRFSDGTFVTLAPASTGRVLALARDGARLALEQGILRAEVVHTGRAAWTIDAGPFSIRVTGTRFATSWDPRAGRFSVDLEEGSVAVEGPLLGAGMPLAAGQRLDVDVGAARATLGPRAADGAAGPAAPAGPSVAGHPAAPAAAAAPQPAAPARLEARPGWQALARGGSAPEALAAAEAAGLGGICAGAGAADLLLLADVARYAGRPDVARRAFTALGERFPRDPRAADALFGLGVLALEVEGRPARAAALFAEYLAAWPRGELGREAAGRLVEAREAAGDGPGAAEAARGYLRDHPDGPHAPLARRTLERATP